jgi:hypothetical protein
MLWSCAESFNRNSFGDYLAGNLTNPHTRQQRSAEMGSSVVLYSEHGRSRFRAS